MSTKTSLGSIRTCLSVLFRSSEWHYGLKSRKVVRGMSVVSVQIPENIGVSASGNPIEIPTPERSPNEFDWCKVSTNKADAVEKCLGPIAENARNQGCMCPELSVFSNSGYIYAIYPIAIALFCEKGGMESHIRGHCL